jgi:hypothetical protein
LIPLLSCACTIKQVDDSKSYESAVIDEIVERAMKNNKEISSRQLYLFCDAIHVQPELNLSPKAKEFFAELLND